MYLLIIPCKIFIFFTRIAIGLMVIHKHALLSKFTDMVILTS